MVHRKKNIQLDRKNDFAILEISSFPDQPHTHTQARTNHINHSSEPFNFVPPSFIPFSHNLL